MKKPPKNRTLATQFLIFDDELQRLDVPPLSPWWRTEITRYLDAYERTGGGEWWTAAGRGGSKSTTFYKLAMFFALFGDFTVPEDERHWAIVLSRVK